MNQTDKNYIIDILTQAFYDNKSTESVYVLSSEFSDQYTDLVRIY
ncbi:hypothetical protein [Brumimicrobium mesophilum]|nr:hypothetical protein [Brumimicrobium mesophilum]